MKKEDLYSSLFFFLFGGAFIIGSLSYPTRDRYGPGPGFFPLLLGVLFSALSLLLFVGSVARKEEDKKEGGSQLPILRPVLYLCVLFGFYFLFEQLGFILTLFFFMTGVLFLFGRRSIRFSLSISVLATFFAYIIFVKLLSVPLPPGILKDVVRLY